ncbi:O-succinylbenzoic acid--CoA ligase [Maribacter algicola]|uniref:O-succinylbenzoic acid--CoA ligase n=1 Tax=Maribacter algicola TaxID=2498892 RepID=A0A3R8Q3A3_9FLAO|nr:AMP-binding protein [Maribacter algicola]RRQ48789.1 O-succinylbenzoic acid--CoA ligase [Maribacter algicola]
MPDIMVHPNFKIDGKLVSWDGISEIAQSFLKEGVPFKESIGRFILDWISPDDHIHVQTSGSTGNPKKISLLKKHMRNSALATGAYFNLQPGDTCLLCLPCDYIAGKMMLVRALVLGLDIYIAQPSTTPLKQIHTPAKFRFCAMVPMQVQASLDDIERIDTLITGGAALPKETASILAQMRTKCFETYGMTETITHVAIKEITEESDQPFRALPNVYFSLDERECLVVKAPGIASENIVTNDRVALLSDSAFIWLGRHDNVINSGGVKLFPESIEEKLSAFMENPFIIAGMPDERLGQKLVLIIESDSLSTWHLPNLHEINSLEPFERPKDILYLPTFIRTKNGKIQRELTLQKAIINQ